MSVETGDKCRPAYASQSEGEYIINDSQKKQTSADILANQRPVVIRANRKKSTRSVRRRATVPIRFVSQNHAADA
ncbi:hypothetical protein R0J90_17900, partial [Micrococcus sp. SIMBA_144]